MVRPPANLTTPLAVLIATVLAFGVEASGRRLEEVAADAPGTEAPAPVPGWTG